MFLRSFGCSIFIFTVFCSFDKVLKILLLICTSDECFGTWTVVWISLTGVSWGISGWRTQLKIHYQFRFFSCGYRLRLEIWFEIDTLPTVSQNNPQIKNRNRVASSEESSPPVSPGLPTHSPILIWNPMTGLQHLLVPVWPVVCSQIYSVMQVEDMPCQRITFHPDDGGKLFTNQG